MLSEPKEEVWFPIETSDYFNSNFCEGITLLLQMAGEISFQEMLIFIYFPLNWMQSKPLTEWNYQLSPSGKLPMEIKQFIKTVDLW